ncbi:MAG: hypothetical protein CMB31_04285 [Euryarchaeota archaeon]|nr:hypothetical protein [Euryarchaeota archaeon]|tara:strand:- start:2610 stop:3023 length:414 start_codon:yes stop_codon:yes gene_type:complete
MQTVYILKDCLKSYRALMLLYKNPDISTNIIIVDKFYYKVLKLDNRVTRFPFIINTAPTNTGLIPSVARVLPLDLFIDLSDPFINKDKKKNKVIKNKQIYEKQARLRSVYRNRVLTPAKGVPIIRKTSDGGVNIVLN